MGEFEAAFIDACKSGVKCRYKEAGLEPSLIQSPSVLPPGVVMVMDHFSSGVALPSSLLGKVLAMAEAGLEYSKDIDYYNPETGESSGIMAFVGNQQCTDRIHLHTNIIFSKGNDPVLTVTTASPMGIKSINLIGRESLQDLISSYRLTLGVEDKLLDHPLAYNHTELKDGETMTELYYRSVATNVAELKAKRKANTKMRDDLKKNKTPFELDNGTIPNPWLDSDNSTIPSELL